MKNPRTNFFGLLIKNVEFSVQNFALLVILAAAALYSNGAMISGAVAEVFGLNGLITLDFYQMIVSGARHSYLTLTLFAFILYCLYLLINLTFYLSDKVVKREARPISERRLPYFTHAIFVALMSALAFMWILSSIFVGRFWVWDLERRIGDNCSQCSIYYTETGRYVGKVIMADHDRLALLNDQGTIHIIAWGDVRLVDGR